MESTKVTIRTSQDLLNLPNYLSSIDPKTQPLRRIITGYYLNSEFPCGLTGCHQPHKEGYLVELEDGHVSNVGWKCGAHFGEKFTTERNLYVEQELRPNAIRTVQEVAQRIQGMRKELDHLTAEADRLSRCKDGLRFQFAKLYPELVRRAHSGNDRVTEQAVRTQKEIDDLQAMNPSTRRELLRYREDFRGVLPGLRTLSTQIRDEVVSQFTGRAESLLTTNVTPLSTDKLLEWEGWASRFDETLARARSFISTGNAFFSPECFRLLAYVAIDSSEKAALSKLTVASLLKERNDPARANTGPADSFAMSKKQRDIQKKLAAMQRTSRHGNR